MQTRSSDAPRSRKSSAKLARNHCKIPRILARRGQRSCLKSASMRCVIQTTSLQLLNGSAVRPNAKKWRVWHRCHANFVPKSREKIAKFPDIRRAARTKTAQIRPGSAAHTQRNVAEVDRVDVAYHFKKARVWRRNHANVAPKSRVKIAKFLKIFGAPRAQKIACTRPACAATRITSSKLFTKS